MKIKSIRSSQSRELWDFLTEHARPIPPNRWRLSLDGTRTKAKITKHSLGIDHRGAWVEWSYLLPDRPESEAQNVSVRFPVPGRVEVDWNGEPVQVHSVQFRPTLYLGRAVLIIILKLELEGDIREVRFDGRI